MKRADVRLIAECACDLADKALHWKARALAAETALASFAGEVYARDRDGSGEAGQTAKQAGPKAIARPEGHRPKGVS